MPEYLAPGVYVEEVSFRSKSIEGVSTTTTGFIGPARYGPVDMEPDVITSLGEFERVYGDRQKLQYGDDAMDNYLWHAARAFFQEGGRRLYVSRVFRAAEGSDGFAQATIGTGNTALKIRARFPGAAGGEMRVRLTLRLSQNILSSEPERDSLGRVQTDDQGKVKTRPKIGSVLDRDVVWISNLASPLSPVDEFTEGRGDYYIASRKFDSTSKEWTWEFNALTTSPPISPLSSEFKSTLGLKDLNSDLQGDTVRVVTLSIAVTNTDGDTQVWDDIPLDPEHERAGSPDSVFARFSEDPGSLSQALRLPIVIDPGEDIGDGLDVLQTLLQHDANLNLRDQLDDLKSSDNQRSIVISLDGGDDGVRPTAFEYEGEASPTSTKKTGLKALEGIDDISIVAAPGSSFRYDNGYRSDAQTIMGLLISHAENMRYRIAVIDSGNDQAIADVRALRARLDSKYAALYYPWVRILDPLTQREINVPPSGFVAGIYARNDINRAVYKAPANEVVNLAIGFEQLLNKSQQDVLNPEGINCFRYFEGRGFRLWGARTISSDPEWKYVNLRRYFAYVEHSIDKGTQWAVFEPNGEALWANIRRTIEDFLFNEWVSGALLGDKPEKAFFVRCDRSTMTQNDLDNGRLVCQIGIAPLRPAEFVIFRIGQWTADRKS
jgi:Bacteriophage tail sheath protein